MWNWNIRQRLFAYRAIGATPRPTTSEYQPTLLGNANAQSSPVEISSTPLESSKSQALLMATPSGIIPLRDIDVEIICLEHTDLFFKKMHATDKCAGEPCTIHNRTEHHMRSFKQHWRGDRAIMERICEHGVGHPDPDEYRIRLKLDDGVHGCDGCCYKA